MEIPIILYDPVTPILSEQLEALCDELGANLEYECNFRDSEFLVIIFVPSGVCDKDVIWGLQDMDHPNLVIRRDLMGELI